MEKESTWIVRIFLFVAISFSSFDSISYIFIDFSCNWMLFVEFSNLKFSVVEIKFYGYYIFVLVLICLIGNCGLALNVIYICILILTFS